MFSITTILCVCLRWPSGSKDTVYLIILYHCRCIGVDVDIDVDIDVDVDVESKKTERHNIVSMMVMCNDIGIIEHDRRRSGLPNAPVIMEHENSINRGISL